VRDSARFIKFRCDDVGASVLLNAEPLTPLTPVKRLCILLHYSSSGLSPNFRSVSISSTCLQGSNLLSMSSSSWYSLNTVGVDSCPAAPGGSQVALILLCKLRLGDVPFSMTSKLIIVPACAFYKDCRKSYIEFEIQERDYDLSYPDAHCENKGVSI
jgi:hypothetical protein